MVDALGARDQANGIITPSCFITTPRSILKSLLTLPAPVIARPRWVEMNDEERCAVNRRIALELWEQSEG